MKKKLNLKTILQFVLSVSVFCLFVCVQLQAQVSEEALGDFLTIEEAKTQEDYSEQVSAAEHDTEVLIIGEEEGETGYSSEDQLANTDELNRKFEEFIRKMKEEIRIEAQRQPIEV
ncbi:hypothetical protein VIGAN_01540700 [Vigna angularis var. angularis]|uniref:Uncharacterized protein n=1 Tax=Vigna angularis var. angularis TaxID=157739 RepID=A0A0S3R9W4_PHAAN|nr:hypothetical protein VIGAN_01540700 [Vigna angularis var. angularis]